MSGRSAASLSDPVLCGPGGYFHWMSIGTSARKEDEVKELNKDDEFMLILIFREFVKYEQTIVDFAMEMHQKQ
eukprot:scaffold2532_cov79-Skeletonema_menzelii.AAC.41